MKNFVRGLCGGSGESQRRLSPLGIQMLGKSLYEQVFGREGPGPSQEAVDRSIEHLTRHGLWGRHVKALPDVEIELPRLLGDNISDHFVKMAESQLKGYAPLINSLLDRGLPAPPTHWNYQAGWTRYDAHGIPTLVPSPNDRALILDVEVCVREGHAPTLAVAASSNGWYSWVSERLVKGHDYLLGSKVTAEDLIPLGVDDTMERLIVGHNVSYDRARIKEQYSIKVSF